VLRAFTAALRRVMAALEAALSRRGPSMGANNHHLQRAAGLGQGRLTDRPTGPPQLFTCLVPNTTGSWLMSSHNTSMTLELSC